MSAAKVWNGTSWEVVGGNLMAQVQPGAPSGPAIGQLWLDTDEDATPFGNPPHFKGSYINAAVTANTNIAFTSVEDTDVGWSAGIYTIKRAGIYRFSLRLQVNGTGVAVSDQSLYKGGVQVEYLATSMPGTAYYTIQGWAEYRCALNDQMSVRSNVTFTTNNAPSSYLCIDWLRS